MHHRDCKYSSFICEHVAAVHRHGTLRTSTCVCALLLMLCYITGSGFSFEGRKPTCVGNSAYISGAADMLWTSLHACCDTEQLSRKCSQVHVQTAWLFVWNRVTMPLA